MSVVLFVFLLCSDFSSELNISSREKLQKLPVLVALSEDTDEIGRNDNSPPTRILGPIALPTIANYTKAIF